MNRTETNQRIESWAIRNQNSIRIVAFGSSNTELSLVHAGCFNWVSWLTVALKAQIGHHICVINRGIGGETTSDLLRRMDRDVFSFAPEMVIVTIGGNDAMKGMSIAEYTRQLGDICSRIRKAGILPILQTYYCPLYDQLEAGFQRHFEAFVQANHILSAREQYPLIDQYACFQPLYEAEPAGYAGLMRDAFHMNHLGNFLMARNVFAALNMASLAVPENWLTDMKQLPDLIQKLF